MAGLEDLVIQRGIKAIRGKINPWDLPEWRPSVEGVRTAGTRSLEDLGSALRKTDVRGPAAGTLLEKTGEGTNDNVLNLATNLAGVPETYVGKGLSAEEEAANRAQREMQARLEAYTALKGMRAQKKASSWGSNYGTTCCWIFETDGKLTQAVRQVRDELFKPDSFVARGYRAMSKWLVPKMVTHKSVRLLVRWTMLNPISKFCEKKNRALIPICIACVLVWELYGRIDYLISSIIALDEDIGLLKLLKDKDITHREGKDRRDLN